MLSVFDQGPPPPCPAPFNLARHVLTAGAATPDKIALAILGPARAERWSYARLTEAVRGTATGLLQTGLAPGDRVLLRLGNTVDFPLAYLGAIAAGLVPVPTAAQLTDREVAALLPGLEARAILRAPDIPCPATDLPVIDSATLTRWRALPPADWHMGDPERLGYIVFTSGTSGKPRAVGHAHRAIWARRMMMMDWSGLTEDDRLLHAGAFNWTYTLGTGLMDPWTMGATALIPAQGCDPAQIPLLMKRADATILAAAPGVFRGLLARELPALPKLRHALAAGEKLSDRLRARWRAATGTEIFEAYGMSECSTFVSAAPRRPAPEGVLGYPQTGRRLAILGPDHMPAPMGEDGEIAVHRDDPGLMLGYLNAPEESAARMAGPWFRTGDRGRMAQDGAITYLGRDSDLMNAGGFRVSPLEVEAALADLPVRELAVAEVEIKADATIIAAFYTADTPQDSDTLSRLAAERLARYKQPRLWQQVADLPKNPNGKLLRKGLPGLLTRPDQGGRPCA